MRTILVLSLAISLPLTAYAEETRDDFVNRMVKESNYTSKRLSQAQRITAIAAAMAELNGEINRLYEKAMREKQSAETRCLAFMSIEKEFGRLASEFKDEQIKASHLGLDADFHFGDNLTRNSIALTRLIKFREESAREYGAELFSAALNASRSLPTIPAAAGIPFCDTSETTINLTRLRSRFQLAVMQNDLREAVSILHRAQALIEKTKKTLLNCGIKDQPIFEMLALGQGKLRLHQWDEALNIANECLADRLMKPNCVQLMSKRSTAVAIAKNFYRRTSGLKKTASSGVEK